MLSRKNFLGYGFTLVELSIVLLIIGLIIGGITAGSSLIKQARLRAILSEFNQYKTAVNVFKIQFNALPGDMANATMFWPSTVNGDGNWIIVGYWTVGCEATTCNESLHAWEQLALSGILTGSYTGVSAVSGQADTTNMPLSKFNPGGWYFYTDWPSSQGLNRVAVAAFLDALTAGAPPIGALFIPTDSYNIDQKIDDGIPVTGSVFGYGGSSSLCADTVNKVYYLTHVLNECYMHFNFGL
jgi:prepilin-type N-terminal cleavage/methylation domain-containing protein